MTATEIFPGLLDLPPAAAWAAMSSLSSAIVGFWLGRLNERQSKKEAARIALVSCISGWKFKVESADDMICLRRDSLAEIKHLVFIYGAHSCARRKKQLEERLREYRDLEDESLYACDVIDLEQKLNPEKFEAAKKLVLYALDRIRAVT